MKGPRTLTLVRLAAVTAIMAFMGATLFAVISQSRRAVQWTQPPTRVPVAASVAAAESEDAQEGIVREYKQLYIIGDSISMWYTSHLLSPLENTCAVMHAPGNCRSSREILQKMDGWLAGYDPDVVLVNCGIHDVTRTERWNFETQIPVDEYEANLREIIRRLRQVPRAPRLIWARTTPVIDEVQQYRRNEDVVAYNEVADKVMAEAGVEMIDLYGAVIDDLSDLSADGVHFKPAGYSVLAKTIAAHLLEN